MNNRHMSAHIYQNNAKSSYESNGNSEYKTLRFQHEIALEISAYIFNATKTKLEHCKKKSCLMMLYNTYLAGIMNEILNKK